MIALLLSARSPEQWMLWQYAQVFHHRTKPDSMCTVGSERRRHRSLIDVIQDLEQENAAEIASSGVSPASDRPVPLDLSGAISEPMPIPSTSGQHARGQALEQPPALRPGVPHHLRPSDDGSEPVPCPPGKTVQHAQVASDTDSQRSQMPKSKLH